MAAVDVFKKRYAEGVRIGADKYCKRLEEAFGVSVCGGVMDRHYKEFASKADVYAEKWANGLIAALQRK